MAEGQGLGSRSLVRSPVQRIDADTVRAIREAAHEATLTAHEATLRALEAVERAADACARAVSLRAQSRALRESPRRLGRPLE